MKFTLSTLLWTTFGLGTAAAFFGLPLVEAKHRQDNANAAIESLQAIATAQALYREEDKDGNGVLDYAPDLASLGRCGLIDPDLAAGERRGYRFAVRHHVGSPSLDCFVWTATAAPIALGETGEFYLGIGSAGILAHSRERAVVFEQDGTPEGYCLVIGR